jgi:hypothetical protein
MNSLRVNRVSVASCLVRLPVCVLALLSGALQLGAVTHVTLNGSATPTAADVAVTNVTVVGHGFPSGTIPPANVTVTLDPTTPGSGPSGTTTAKTVTVASGTTEYVTFLVPSSISVPTATSYQVSIAGTTSTGTAFASTNTAALTVNAPVSITTSTPLPQGDVNSNYSQALTATGGSGTYTWAVAAGTLPGNLSLNPTTGVICCMPSTAGTSHFEIKATDSLHLPSGKVFALTINPALVITTTSPLPAATVSAGYSQTFAASGGSGGGYTWSATGLPAWLSLSTAGALTGTPPLTAIDSTFTVTVTDSSNNSTSGSFSVPVTLAIITTSPLPTGQVGVNYSQTLTAIGGTGVYTWAPNVGSSLPGGLLLNATSGVLSGSPSTASAFNFTILVTDSNHATATQAFALTINPAASIQTLSPNSSNAGLSLQVSITGSYTHFVQGTTVANFGAGIAVGGAAEGQPGPVTVNSSTSATASIVIDPAAATGSQTVTVTTGAEQAAIVNGFTIQTAIPYISVTTTSTTPLAPGFSGFNDAYLLHGIEYWDPKWLAAVAPLDPGWIRFPAGTLSFAFDWQTAEMNGTWMAELKPEIPTVLYQGLEIGQELTQAKGGACFSGGSCVSDYGTFLKTLGANGIVSFNGYTDNLADSAGLMVTTAKAAGLNILEWEIDNEPYSVPGVFPTGTAYATAAYNPYYLNINAADPSAIAGIFYQGQYIELGNYVTFDAAMAAYSPRYWQGVSIHVYPVSNQEITTSAEEMQLNGILAHGTTDWYTSTLQPEVGENTPIYFTEVNSDGFATLAFESYIYNGIFLAEFTSRMSTIPQVQAVGIAQLFLPNTYNQGIVRAVNDFQTYLLTQLKDNPNYSTNTATNPNTQYSFYNSTSALAMEIANLAINSSNATWPTTVTGGPTVPISGYDGNPVPAVFAQGYQGTNGTHYLVITNKSASSVPMAIEVDGNLLQSTVTVSYISNASDTAQNTATEQTNVQIVNTTSPNPLTIGPYSVTRVQW